MTHSPSFVLMLVVYRPSLRKRPRSGLAQLDPGRPCPHFTRDARHGTRSWLTPQTCDRRGHHRRHARRRRRREAHQAARPVVDGSPVASEVGASECYARLASWNEPSALSSTSADRSQTRSWRPATTIAVRFVWSWSSFTSRLTPMATPAP